MCAIISAQVPETKLILQKARGNTSHHKNTNMGRCCEHYEPMSERTRKTKRAHATQNRLLPIFILIISIFAFVLKSDNRIIFLSPANAFAVPSNKPPPPLKSRAAVNARSVRSSGGRTPSQPDRVKGDGASPNDPSTAWEPSAPAENEAKLIVIQITDVYTLEHFASLKTLIAETRRRCEGTGAKVISMLTGDFLAPYLLSSVDRGVGMMKALAETPVDYLMWGNHEADIDHRTVCRHVRNFPGTWLNSNMRDHEAMDAQKEYDVIEVCSPDGKNARKVGMVAVLSDDPDLYSHFKAPGAFGGAVNSMENPWECLRRYKDMLEGPEHGCDVILPLQHTYVPDDHRTCREFDFPVLLSGHDHHRVDEVFEGTRLLKPGLDAVYATIMEMSWPDGAADKRPKVRAKFVKTADWTPDPDLHEQNIRAYDALAPLHNTELARVPPSFEPLSSNASRGKVCTMGRFICTLLRSSLNSTRRQREHRVDAVILMGGNIRGGKDYPSGSFFSLEALEAEVKSDEVIGVVPMPGWLINEGIKATHAGDPIPGWFQYDIGVEEGYVDGSSAPVVTTVGGRPLEPNKVYRVSTKISDLTNGQSEPFTKYFNAHPELLPTKGAYVNIHAELMGFFAKNLWRKIWETVSLTLDDELCCQMNPVADHVHCNQDRFAILDQDGDGAVGVDEIHNALRDVLHFSVDDHEKTLAKLIHSYADRTGDGTVTFEDFEQFCEVMPNLYSSSKWKGAFYEPDPVDDDGVHAAHGVRGAHEAQSQNAEDEREISAAAAVK